MVEKCKHSSLTRYFKRKATGWSLAGYALEQIFRSCDVNHNVGCLPPELLKQIQYKNVAQTTSKFRIFLSEFIERHFSELAFSSFGYWNQLDYLSELLGTPCEIESYGAAPGEPNLRRGGFGVVCKLSFPKINADYALKIYYNQSARRVFDYIVGGGKSYEIPVAFAAFHAEPSNNNPCYMASLKGPGYLLSKWAGDENSPDFEKNKNKIFCTSKEEDKPKNYRQGKRVDFGETFKTPYGVADYQVRKLYRKFLNNSDEINNCLNASGYVQKQKIKSAISLIQQMADFNQKIR